MVELGMEYITTKKDGSILGVGRMVKYGTEQNTTNTETSYTGGLMGKESIITSMLSSDNIVEVDY